MTRTTRFDTSDTRARRGTGWQVVTVVAVVCTLAWLTGPAAAQPTGPAGMEGNGTAADPYVITNATQLQAMNQDLDAHYVLGADIDASATAEWNGGKGFVPVGDSPEFASRDGEPFTGTLDGRNHTITGLTLARPRSNFVALVGYSDGRVVNLGVEDASIHGGLSTATVVGENRGQVENVVTSGEVRATDDYTGGLVGHNYGGVDRSGAAVRVRGTDLESGGLVGGNEGEATIRRSYATGDVTNTEKYTGGLVGQNNGRTTNAYATGDVEGTDFTGAFTGNNNALVEAAYATGDMTGEKFVGPFSEGLSDDEGTTRHGYFTGSIAVETERVEDDAGTRVTTAEITGPAARETLDGFDFEDTWLVTDSYPVLRWQVDDVELALDRTEIAANGATNYSVTATLQNGETVTSSAVDVRSQGDAVTVTDGRIVGAQTGTATVTASIGDASTTETVEVLAPPDVTVTDAALERDLLGAGAPATLRVTVENTGGITGTAPLDLTAGGEAVATRPVTVEPGETTTVTTRWTPPEIGTYDLAVNGTTAGELEVVAPPDITVEGASLATDAVMVGTPVRVDATLSNTDRIAGQGRANLSAGGTVVASSGATVDAGRERPVSVTWTPEEPGTYDLTVDGTDAGSVTVVPAGSVAVEEVSLPEQVVANRSYAVTATVTNDADTPVTVPLTYRLDGDVVARTNATVASGGSPVRLDHATATTGEVTHTVSITGDGITTAGTVQATPELVVASVDAPSTVTVGESVTASATIENTGSVAAERNVTLAFAGREVTRAVNLDAGETATVSADLSAETAGEATLVVATGDENATATVDIESQSTGDGNDTAAGTSGGSGPGFGIVVGVLALLAAAALAGRRDGTGGER